MASLQKRKNTLKWFIKNFKIEKLAILIFVLDLSDAIDQLLLPLSRNTTSRKSNKA